MQPVRTVPFFNLYDDIQITRQASDPDARFTADGWQSYFPGPERDHRTRLVG